MSYGFKHKIQLILLGITTIITVFAALPLFFNSDIYKGVLILIWIINFFCNIALFKMSFTTTGFVVMLSWLFYIIYCAVMYIVRGDGYITGIYFYSVNLAVFVFINGCFLSHERTENVLDVVLTVYNVGSVFVVLYIYLTEFWGIQYLEAQTYIYDAKNSIGPIIVCNLIILSMRKVKNNIVVKAARYVCQGFFVYILLLVNNRAGVVQLIAILLCYILFTKKSLQLPSVFRLNRSTVVLILVVCWTISMIMLFYSNEVIEKTSSFINWALKFEKAYDINEFSSNRILFYNLTIDYAINVFPLFGTGEWYVDLFYLSAIAELGFIGAIPVFTIVLTIFLTAVKNIKKADNYLKLLGFFSVQLLTAAFFEALPPFGPGTVVFMFWLLFGTYAGAKVVDKRQDSKNTADYKEVSG